MRDLLQRHRRLLTVLAGLIAAWTLAGFFLAPWLVERQAVRAMAEQFDSELRLERVAINPYVLSLTIDGLALDDPAGEPLARVRQIHVNFQTSSLFRWAWTFAEFRIDAPELFISRDGAGAFNFRRLLAARPPAAEEPPPPDEEGGPLRFILHEAAVTDAALHWRDAVPPQPVETRFGPVDVRVQGLNTLPERPGTQEVVIRTATEGTLTWSGSLQMNPFRAAGEAAIDGSHFELLSAYIRHETGLDITDGDADIDFTYNVAARPDGVLGATVDDLDVVFNDVRVLTFPAAADGGPGREPRELLSVPRIALAGGRLRWPERSVSAESFDIDGAVLALHRDTEGTLDVVRNLPAREATPTAEADADAEPAAETPSADETGGDGTADEARPWRFSLGRFRIADLAASLRDESVEPAAEIGVDAVQLEIRDLGNEPGASFPTTLSLQSGRGGRAELDGTLTVLPALRADFGLGIDGIPLAWSHPYIQPLADVSLDSGVFDADARLATSPDDPLRFEGDIAVRDFLITETDLGTRLGSWERVAASGIVFSLADANLEVSEVRLERPYGDILITEEGQVNLGRVAKGEADADTEAEAESEPAGEGPAAAETEPSEAEGEELPIRVTVGRVVIADGAADFADRSLPLPFSVKIAGLNGELSTIATASTEPSSVSLEGRVDEYGFLRITGSVTPLAPAENTDLRAEFENVAMPRFSAYSVPFAGRKIASGRLSLDLGYRLTGGRLVGDNNIVLREFELGEQVPHPDAMSLPLGLAIALLKDSSGTIDVDLPITGEVDDPEFSIGGIVAKALGNLIVKIATSPFALLGNLLGVEASELEQVTFLPGRADLTPPEVQKAANLAEALTLRPQLVLELPPVQAPAADGRALREAKLEAAVSERVTGVAGGGEAGGMYAERRREALEALYRELATVEDPQSRLDALRAENTRVVETAEGEPGQPGETRFDATAYAADLADELVPLQPLEEGALAALAAERAANLRETILAAGSELEGRVLVTEPAEVSLTDNDRVAMKVTLTADRQAAAAQPPEEDGAGPGPGEPAAGD
ncbi:DUF748 domain-containing protein [Lentisalinibacter salinarum]|uniref:DUF748 domain-containing protein n=1 Tax=Lentisalinibacter salinarum TaxID=2992239 RepID=UPI00386F4572